MLYNGTTPMEKQSQVRRRVAAWEAAGRVMERLRHEEILGTDTREAIKALLGPCDFTREPFLPRPSSGLVEQQALFKKLARD